jgi:hypothetical protein
MDKEVVKDIGVIDRNFLIDKIYNGVWAEHESLKALLRNGNTIELIDARQAMKEALHKLGRAKEREHEVD